MRALRDWYCPNEECKFSIEDIFSQEDEVIKCPLCESHLIHKIGAPGINIEWTKIIESDDAFTRAMDDRICNEIKEQPRKKKRDLNWGRFKKREGNYGFDGLIAKRN